jgi:predicted nucleic acid-binding Zn ribbon protein
MIKRTNDKTIKEAVEQLLNVYKLRRKFDETSLIAAWPEMMGKAIASRTTQMYIRERRMFIRVDSSVVKNELVMIRSQILDKMNERAGKTVLDEIVFL